VVGRRCLSSWRTARTHLGGFFQRILDGDALDIVIRKAVAATGSMLNPLAMGLVLAGVVVWVLLFRRLLPPGCARSSPRFKWSLSRR
jgi:hypothetical protein